MTKEKNDMGNGKNSNENGRVAPKLTYYISNGVCSTPIREKGGVEDIYKGIYHK